MRVLMVNKFLYPKGGAETYIFKLGEYLKAAGHEVEYFGMQDDKNIVGNTAGEYTQNMDFHGGGLGRFLYPFRIIYSLSARKKLRKIINAFKPHIIHLNNINYQITPSIIDEIKGRGIPVVQTVHDVQMLCPSHLMFDLNKKQICEKCLSGSKLNCVKGRCIHGSLAKSAVGTLEAWLYGIKGTYRLVDKYICPSRFIEEKLLQKKRLGKYIYRGKTEVIHNYIELSEENTSYSKEDYILYFGRFSVEKGVDILAEAIRALPQIPFKIAGSGPMENIFRDIPNAELVGFKTGEELRRLIARAYASVYPSVWYENCPLSVLESEALGTPVISSGLGGLPELVEDGETGIILKEVTAEALTDSIKTLWDNPDLAREMSKNCLNKRNRMITLDKYGARIEEIYSEVQ